MEGDGRGGEGTRQNKAESLKSLEMGCSRFLRHGPQLFNVALHLEGGWQLDRLRSHLPVTPEKAVPAILDKINKFMPVPQTGNSHPGALR